MARTQSQALADKTAAQQHSSSRKPSSQAAENGPEARQSREAIGEPIEFSGAAVVREDGTEIPITGDMVQRACRQLCE